ncbi:flavodoxin family protein [Oceanidesulfovibrio indonesiensis]|nr:flavodoxin family protein [Oceanidesulfovibrio indonesiensis]
MKVLGISGSPRKDGTTARLVHKVLEATGLDFEFISLAGKDVRPCMFCLGCARDNVCKIKDYVSTVRESLVEAEAYVVGGCNMWSTLNGLAHNFLERFYQFHHLDQNPNTGKVGVAVGVGAENGRPPAVLISSMFQEFGIRPLGSVVAKGVYPCYTCGVGDTCTISNVQGLDAHGNIDMSRKPCLDTQPDVIGHARRMGERIAAALSSDSSGC